MSFVYQERWFEAAIEDALFGSGWLRGGDQQL